MTAPGELNPKHTGESLSIEEPFESLERSAKFWEGQDPKCASLLRLLAVNYPWLLKESEGFYVVSLDGTWGERILERTFDSVTEAFEQAENRGIGYAGLVHKVKREGIGQNEVFVKSYPLARLAERKRLEAERKNPRRTNEVYLTEASVIPAQPQELSRFKRQ